MKSIDEFYKLTDAEDYFDFFGVAYEKHIVEVKRFHIMKKFGELVEKAKGVLMRARGLDEDGAYHAIRKLAMERGQTMAKVSADVIEMAKLLL